MLALSPCNHSTRLKRYGRIDHCIHVLPQDVVCARATKHVRKLLISRANPPANLYLLGQAKKGVPRLLGQGETPHPFFDRVCLESRSSSAPPRPEFPGNLSRSPSPIVINALLTLAWKGRNASCAGNGIGLLRRAGLWRKSRGFASLRLSLSPRLSRWSLRPLQLCRPRLATTLSCGST